MVSSDFQKIIKSGAKEFDVKTVWLFGSSLEDQDQAHDIDLAVEGVAPERFFDFYRKLYFSLSKPVDLVDMGLDPPMSILIRQKGVRIYER